VNKKFIERIKEERAKDWEKAKALLDTAADEKRDLTAEERQEYDRINTALDERALWVKDLEGAEQREADMAAAMDRILAQPDERKKELEPENAELRKFLRGETRAFDLRPEGRVDYRSLSKGTATAGGNTVPTSFYDQLIAHLIEVSGVMMAGPTVLNTDSGENIEVPTTTAHSSGAIVSEGAAIGASDPAFAKRTLGAYKYGVLIQVSSELLADTGVDLEGYLAMQAGRALGNAFGAHLVTGTGSSQPTGVITSASTGVTGGAGVTGAFTADNLIDLYFSVIAPYRNSQSCSWLMKDSTLAAVRKLKDTTNQYLWQPSVQVGVPDTLLGKPVVTDPNVAAVALSAKSVAFGDFSAYFVRQVNGVRFERSDDYAFNTDLVTFRALLRGDGLTVDQTGAIKVFTGNAA